MLPLLRDHYYNEDMGQKPREWNGRTKFGPQSWGRFYRKGNCFLPLFKIYSYVLVAALSFMVCEHPTSASVHVSEGPWGISKGSCLFTVLQEHMTASRYRSPSLVNACTPVCPLPGSEPPVFQLMEQEPTCIVRRPN